MNQKKQVNPLLLAHHRATQGERGFLCSPDEERKNRMVRNSLPTGPIILLAAVVSRKAAEDLAPDEERTKKLTAKEMAQITKETKTAVRALSGLPSTPFSVIIPAPGLSSFNPQKLCVYVDDKLPRIAAIAAFANCTPAVADVKTILMLLFPLAGIGRKNLTETDKLNRDMYKVQLRQNFMLMINSCAALALGNLPLFSLTGVATRRKAQKHTGKLQACVFKLNAKKGAGTVGVSCKAIPFATKYIIYYGKGDYDKATWNSQIGGARQKVTGLTPGEKINFIMVAIGATGEGDWANPQFMYVPYN